MAPPASAEVGGVAVDRLRVAGGDVDGAEHAEGEGDPADDLTAGRAVALGVAHGAPADPDQHQRDQPADLADRAGHDRAHGRPSGRRAAATRRRPRRPRPGRTGTGRGRRAGARARGRGRCARSCGRPRRRRGRCPARSRRSRGRTRRTGAGPDRAPSGRLGAPGVGCARCCASACAIASSTYSGMRVEGLLLLLLREPGGEDVRVAMVTNLGHRHSRHTDHTPHARRRVRQRRSSSPRTYCACPRWALTSLTTLTRRTPRVTGGSHASSTTRSRSSGCSVATYAALRAATAS